MSETTDSLLRDYVLGELDESARLDIEEQLVTNPEVFEQLDAVILDLTEDYLEGHLGGEPRRHFEQRVLSTSSGQQQLMLVESLRAEASARRKPRETNGFLASIAAFA